MNDTSVNITFYLLVLVLLAALISNGFMAWKIRVLITECEKPLPRTEDCVLIAVPERRSE